MASVYSVVNNRDVNMKIALISDAWQPQVNGVVRTWVNITTLLQRDGHDVLVIHPDLFKTVPCPKYPSIRLAVLPGRGVWERLRAFEPEAIHIATEGPCGMAARRYCGRYGKPYTTSYHTQFPHYLKIYFRVPMSLSYRFMRWFHGQATRCLAPSESVRAELAENGFRNAIVWSRGVDLERFRPRADDQPELARKLDRPIFLNAGRVSEEKNLAAFCQLDLPGSRVLIGDGPQLSRLKRKYPQVHFTGYLPDEELARWYAAADVFVFPSLTDTFGNVMLEALASGTPVAAHGVTGPVDFIQDGITGCLSADLQQAAMNALNCDRKACRAYAETRPWRDYADQFFAALHPIGQARQSAG